MRKWNDQSSQSDAERKTATYTFCQMLDEYDGLRIKCKEDKDVAWDTLRKTGDFEDMPRDVEVRVFESTIDSNDHVVSIILPTQNQVGSFDAFKVGMIWRCSWYDRPEHMSKWKSNDSPAERKAAAYDFCTKLDGDANLREACKKDQNVAWNTLRDAGEFVDMPHAVEVCVLEDDSITANNKIVTMVLPVRGHLKPFDTFQAAEVWRCTWAHYTALIDL
jgi:hypothetical protein